MRHQAKILLLVVIILLVSAPLSFGRVNAGLLYDQNIQLTCSTLDGVISFLSTRDTSGVKSETFVEEVRDGQGVILSSNAVVNVGSAYFFDDAVSINPQYDPVTYRFYSPAGNGLPEETLFSLTINCGLPTSYSSVSAGCGIADGEYQMALTADTQLFWDPDTKKSVTPPTFIPAGQVVTVLDNDTEGWLHILWACGTYYMPVGTQTTNPAAISKPPINRR